MLNNFFEYLKDKNQLLLSYSIFCFVGGFICLMISKYSSLQIAGISAWIKPFKFFISFGVFALTMAFYVVYLDNQKQITHYCWNFILFTSIELILITLQASRGRKSHYNIDTTSDRIVFALMGLSLMVILIHTTYITLLFFTQKQFNAPVEMILAVKLSLIMMILFMLQGFAMINLFKHTVGAEDGTLGIPVLNWNKNYGDLRVAHFFGMHALQIIPLLTFVLANTKREVYLICLLYFVFVTFTFVQACQGKPFIK